MAAKRTMGATLASHRGVATSHLSFATLHMHAAQEAAHTGHCDVAIGRLINAAEALGSAESNATWARNPKLIARGQLLRGHLNGIARTVTARCLK